MNGRSFESTLKGQVRLRIGEWTADFGANELRRGSETLRLEPKAMEALLFLAQRAGSAVSREEFLSVVWPGVVVGDEALTQAINKLRRALGDNPRAPTYIETLSKRGYRLVAAVSDEAIAPGLSAPASPAPVRPGATRLARIAPWGLAAAAVLALVAAVPLLYSSVGPERDAPFSTPSGERLEKALTVTVLPFETPGGDREQSYLAHGLANELMTDLARRPDLRLVVAPRPGAEGRIATSARYVVSGSVHRVGETVRIHVRLVDTGSGEQLWAERFERPFGDLFAVQDEIVRRLGQSLPARLSSAARARSAKRYTRSLEAYDQFLRGQELFLVRQAGDNDAARAHYRKALELDPGFARAYAGLAMTYAMDFRLRPGANPGAVLARAFELADTARGMDPEIPEVHWALGFVHVQGHRLEQAMASLQRAIELNPSYADAYAFVGGIHTYSGEPAKAVPLLRTALRLNPDGGYLYYLILGRAYLFEGDVEQALINLREAAARNPVDVETRLFLSAALEAAGDHAAASWETEEVRALEAGFRLDRWLESYPLASAPHRTRLVALLGRAGF